jgi:hypothetical protein
MIKNYQTFLENNIGPWDNLQVGDVVRWEIWQKVNKGLKLREHGDLQTFNKNDFKNKKAITTPRVRQNIFLKIYCYQKGQPTIYKTTKVFFNKLGGKITKDSPSKKQRGYLIEKYQVLGFLWKHNTLPKKDDYLDIKLNDFEIEKLSIPERKSLLRDLDENQPIRDYEDFKLLLGSIKFNQFIEKRGFKTETLLHNDKNQMRDHILKIERNICETLDLPLPEEELEARKKRLIDKPNTSDVFLLDSNPNEYLKDNLIIISEPAQKIGDNYEGGICYMIEESKFNLTQMEKDIADIGKYSLDNLKKYNSYLSQIIAKYGQDAFRFIQISLKKSRFDAQFGKATRTINRVFAEVDKDIKENEGFFQQLFTTMVRQLKEYFINSYYRVVERYYEIEKNFMAKFLESLQQKLLKPLSESVFEPQYPNIETQVLNGEFLIHVEDRKAKKDKLPLRQAISVDVNDVIRRIIENHEYYFGQNKAEEFHNKFAEMLTVSLMGGTNLPMYLVYGSEPNEISHTLHVYRINKEMNQVKRTLNYDKNDEPLYVLQVNNYKDGDDLLYRTASILVYNFTSKSRGNYIGFDLRNFSSQRKSFAVESRLGRLSKKQREAFNKLK